MTTLMRQGRRRAAVLTGLLAAAVVLAACASAAARPGHGRAAPGSARSSPATVTPPVVVATTAAVRLPAALSRLVAVPVAGHIVIAGGLDNADHTTQRTQLFDPATNTITPAGALPTAVHDAAAAALGGQAIVVGGGAEHTVAAVQAVTPSGAGTTTGRLPQPRSDDTVAVDGNTLYVAGGYDGSQELPAVLATTNGQTFRRVGQLATTVRYAAAYAAGGSLWVFGGEHQGSPIAAIQRLDIRTETTTVAGTLPTPLAHEAVAVLDGKVLIIGGNDGQHPKNAIYAFNPATDEVTLVGSLPHPVSDMAAAVLGHTAYVIGGNALTAEQTVQATDAVEAITIRTVNATATAHRTGAEPFTGTLLIADRGNNRLLAVNPAGKLLWAFPTGPEAGRRSGFYFPDDAFFIDHGTAIISNQEGNDTVVEVAYPSGKRLWSYGHPGMAGTGPGYLHDPDDAYKLPGGRVVVADADNCRIVIISPSGQQTGQIGTTGSCVHHPPTSLGYPNGDTPLPDGNLLVSEVHGSWISEYTLAGKLVWTVHVPLAYPSDPQQIGPDKYLVADYATPGGIIEFDRAGHVLWDYHVSSGPAMLDHPSLAEVLPSGLICVNDDYRDRVVLIDPATKTIVWQYGLGDLSGTAPGLLNTPDGFDLLASDGSTPTHPYTG